MADGHGTTVTFGTSAWSANIISVDGPSATRDDVDNTHMGTSNAKAFLPSSLYDGGELTLTVEHDASAAVPIDQAAETITIDWAGGGNTYAFSGYMKGYTPGAAIGERMEAQAVIKVTGAITGLVST